MIALIGTVFFCCIFALGLMIIAAVIEDSDQPEVGCLFLYFSLICMGVGLIGLYFCGTLMPILHSVFD